MPLFFILMCFSLVHRIVRCTADENPDLFYSVPWSYGTLGFLVSVEIMIVPCKPYVDLTYIPFTNKEEAVNRFIEETRKENPYDFVECLAYSESDYVLMLGNMTENKHAAEFNPIGMWYQEWFFKHVQHYLERKEPGREIIPLRQYYHRHSKSLFWEIQDIVPFGNNVFFRWAFGWMMPPKVALLKLTQTESIRKLYELHHVVQDMLVPLRDTSKCLEVFHKEVQVYPLWMCPFKVPPNGGNGTADRGFIHPCKDENFFIDIGAYGNPTIPDFEARRACRNLEAFVRDVNGFQMLYADSYMTR